MMKKKKAKYKDKSPFTRNLKLLKKRSKDIWKLVDTTAEARKTTGHNDGESPMEDRIKNSKNLFYGSENPVDVARNYIAEWDFEPFDTIFLIGMGLGYLPMEAFKQGIGNPRMIVIEPSIHVFLDALACMNLNDLLQNPRIELFVGDEIRVADIISRYRQKLPLGKIITIVHPQYEIVFRKAVEPLRKELEEQISEVMTQWFTLRNHGKRMFRNSMANLPVFFPEFPCAA